MSKRFVAILAIVLMASTAAQAQRGGGGGGGGGGGRRGGGGGAPSPSTTKAVSPPDKPLPPVDQAEIVGVITALGPEPNRVTIAYEAVDLLNWPAGSMPFTVLKQELLAGRSVGEKVRFRLEAHQISALAPY
ncbi:MAG TPA: copper-binding protein [Caulobacteraceae bacterium]|jgi:hypothetical protein|nr:copper-binding protein [Caulobacteraceae bacterium]